MLDDEVDAGGGRPERAALPRRGVERGNPLWAEVPRHDDGGYRPVRFVARCT
jgi:hypothetical protein